MSEATWLRARTPDGRWFSIEWDDRTPKLDDIDFMLRVVNVARLGYVPKRALPIEIGGVRVIRLAEPMRAT